MNSNRGGRRRFLKSGVALGLTAGIAPVVRGHDTTDKLALNAYGARSRYVTSVRISDGGANCSFASDCNTLTPLQDSIGIVTPPPLHFIGSHGAYPPDINPAEHELLIHGLVDRPLKFNMAELKRMPFVSRFLVIECTANEPQPEDVTVQHTHGKVACSEWTGVPLSLVLGQVGVSSAAKWFVAEGADRDLHSKSLPIARVEDSFLAWGQNGEPLMPHQGYPLRLIVPGAPGFSQVKWLHRIKLVDQPYLTPSERVADIMTGVEPQLGPKSVITFPSGGQQLTDHGYYTITGLAWSGGGIIRAVEVSTDGGRNWQQAKIHDPVLSMALTRFSLGWNWNGTETTLMSRCTDEKGDTQLTVAELARSAGAPVAEVLSGSHLQTRQWNLVFPWKISSTGNVQHALWA